MARFIPITNTKQHLPVDSFVFMLWEKGAFFVLLFVSCCLCLWVLFGSVPMLLDVFNRSMRKLFFAISYRSDDKIPGLLMVMWLAGGWKWRESKKFSSPGSKSWLGICASSSHMPIFNFEKFSTAIWHLRFPVYVKLNRSVDIEIRWTKKEKNYTLQF